MAQLTADILQSTVPDSRARILGALWRAPGTSRIELADILGLDKSTMSRGVARLMDSGLIEESEAGESGPLGGRRRIGLVVRGDWGLWLGLELQPDQCRGILVDLAGTVRGEFLFDDDVRQDTLETVIRNAGERAVELARRTGIPLMAAGLALPGPVRPGTGIVERSRPLGIVAPSDLSSLGRRILGLPVAVGNDVDWGCRSELHFTDREPAVSFLYLLAEGRNDGLSLGLGTVLNGTVHRGEHGAGGEIVSVHRDDGAEQLALDARVVESAGRNSKALARVARELAPQVAMVANVLDIDLLILGGLFRDRFELMQPIFAEALSRRRTYPDLAVPAVLAAARGSESVAYGAAIHFTENPSTQEYWRTI